MQVNGVAQNTYARPAAAHAAPKGNEVQQAPTDAETVTENSGDRAKGVIRLLQEGHFKGVADLRLRINFHEELQALQGEANGANTQAVLQNLSVDVEGSIEAFLAANPLDETTQSTFTSIRASFELKIEGLIGGEFEGSPAEAITAAFQAFVEDVSALFAPPEETEVVPTDEAVDTEDVEPQSPLQKLLESLQGILASAVESLNNPTSLLPPLSEPSGNGSAFAKFLALYQDLNGIQAPETPDSSINVTL